MFDLLYQKFSNPRSAAGIFVAIAVIATIITIAMPLLQNNALGSRMKAVSTERERIRARERERMSKASKASLRSEPKAYMKQVVDRFSLSKWLSVDDARERLAKAGYRGAQAETAFLFFRGVVPIILFIVCEFYITFVLEVDWPMTLKLAAGIFAAYLGIKAPELYLGNICSKRQQSMRRVFPDAMDLLLICVESGMSIEHAFRKVSTEIGSQSIPLAEELALTTAELSYLPDRRMAYENFSTRTDLDAIKQIVTVLIQAERYGTPLGTAMRVVAQESRDNRMMEAEKKAAGLPPKLTVPMILFFLPVLFGVILTPAIIQVNAMN